VQHLSRDRHSYMAEILARRTALRVKDAADGDQVVPGSLLMAPPDRHLLVTTRLTVRLTESERVRFVRPSADLLFESAAACCWERTLGVVLSGSGSDGSTGVRAIKNAGGTVVAQDPASADSKGMPAAAIATGCVDHIVPLPRIGQAILRLVQAAG
jgi:two-component system, chemotaxis family, protein-glutamate methylesterase/glutaminase